MHAKLSLLAILSLFSAGAICQTSQDTTPSAFATQSKASTAERPDVVTYYVFMIFLNRDHMRVQAEIRSLPIGAPPIIEGKNYWEEMGISPEEYGLVRDTAVTACSRLADNERRWRLARDLWYETNKANLGKAVPSGDMVALGKEHDAIIQGAIDTLRLGLGDRDYPKLDKVVKRKWGGATVYHPPAVTPSGEATH